MRAIGLALVAGAWCVGRFPALPPVEALAAGLLPVLLAAVRWPLLRPAAAFVAGLALAVAAAHDRLEPRLPPEAAGVDLRVTGTVTGLPEIGERHDRFRLRVASGRLGGDAVVLPGLVRLSWYGPDRPRVRPGERWQLTVRLRAPRGFANPGGFDYARWLALEGIGATGYVRSEPAPVRLGAGGAPVDRIRDALRARMLALAGDAEHTGLLLALGVGDRDRIAPAAWDTLLATGTNHLVAISGLHIGLVAAAGFALAGPLWGLLGGLRRRCPRPIFQALAAFALASVYAALAGFALPTQRALIMLAAGLGGTVLRRRTRPGDALALAAIAVVAFDPLAPMSPAFWLSFAAVATILYVLAGRLGRPTRVAGWLRLQLAIGVALVPLLLLWFGEASLVAPLANLVAVPWVSLGVVPLVLAGTALAFPAPELGGLALAAADLALQPLWHGLEWAARAPMAQWQRATPPGWIAALALAGTIVVLAPRGVPGRAAGAVALLPLLAWSPARPPHGAVWLDVLDVGQGLAAVVRTREHTLVYDTGPSFSARFDAGRAVVVPFLRQAGTRRLDALVVSHGDDDHAGGAASVRAAYPAGATWTSVPRELGPEARFCGAGTAWTWDGVRFAFVHPDRDSGLVGNDGSCVLRIDAPGGRILLPGDIEAVAERALVRRGGRLAADVVVAPHHGSASSSTPAFVERVDPAWVIFPVGHDNRWDFPDPKVVQRWRPAGLARTDCGGALRVRIEPRTGVSAPRAYRQRAARFWRAGCRLPGKSGTMRAVVRPGAAASDGG